MSIAYFTGEHPMALPIPDDPRFKLPVPSDDEFFNPKGEEDEAALASGAWDHLPDDDEDSLDAPED